MTRNIINRKPKLLFQIFSIFFSLFTVTIILLIRTNKTVLIESLYEELMTVLPGISSLGNLVDESGEGSQGISRKKKFIELIKYLPKSNILSFNQTNNKEEELPELNIFIPYNSLKLIQKDRVKAIKKGFLFNPSTVNGSLWFKGEKFKIKLRLKGDLPTHWKADKRYSLRIKLNKDKSNSRKSILGMKVFSIHKLRARAYPYEYVFQDLIKEFNLPSVSHKIVKVKINGTDWGKMDMQEHWGIEMLEKNKLKESLILRFGTSYERDYAYDAGYQIPVSKYWLGNPRLSASLSGLSTKNLTDAQKKQYQYILTSLKETNYYKKLFDDQKLLELEEILKIWGNFHPIHAENSRYYFNPYTLKLEPLVHDQGSFRDITSSQLNTIYSYTDGFIKPNKNDIYNNYKLKDKVVKKLSDLSPYYLSQRFFPGDKKLNIDIPKNNNIKFKKYQNNIQTINSNFIPQRAQTSLNCSRNNKDIFTKKFPTLKAYLKGDKLHLNKLICGDFIIEYALICNRKFELNESLVNKDIFINKPEIINIDLDLKNKINCKNDKPSLSYRFNNEKKFIEIKKFDFNTNLENPLILENIPSFIKEKTPNNFYIEKGNWNISEPIFIKGRLIIEKGTKLIFNNDTYLIIKGDLIVNGTNNQPIIMTSLAKEKWKGIHLYNEKLNNNKSIINFLKVEKTKPTQIGILNLTGGVNIYNKNITINGLEINDSIAEDSLNIINSNIDINNLNIKNSISDAFDCDFCTGSVKNLNFSNIGGDGLDISGSLIKGNIQSALNVNDKVVSVGEKSVINIDINNVFNSYVAVAVKDSSFAKAKIKNVQTNGPIAMTYIKKDFYEGPTKAIINYENKDLNYPIQSFKAENGTSLIVNNKKIKTKFIDVEKLYSTGPMKK